MKRLFDILGAAFGLIIFSPIMLVVAVIIKISSPGKVLFSQRRLTKGMREFNIYKFRSMRSNEFREKNSVQIKGSSSEITPIGRFIRKTKLDELPQLWNILKGDMSFIGPRPELPRRLKYYNERQKGIFQVRSGISSPASIVFSDEEYLMNQVKDPEKFYIEQIMPYKIELNLYYIKNRSFFGDIYLIVATFLKILNKIKNENIVKDRELLKNKNKIEKLIGVEY
ncbi:Sugar transferase involved in LPS biosynthesis (colanic, teichoic acid) [Cetobacterium ceti]|uniref:Sugar transferase involved in LPS biosynthesis (Colanic, teichoic acid) n=1 Tax=Cetobacterium ceti TaxID=180163 RepID=A0A1T4LSD2_9FUSO|nr:sugar transferase [Cetobacterium ceti]SJZ57557.1 Sugar transferase involved in LPS biosynthesis (colanic, teichoic acid) [Cetobacterium ceti]